MKTEREHSGNWIGPLIVIMIIVASFAGVKKCSAQTNDMALVYQPPIDTSLHFIGTFTASNKIGTFIHLSICPDDRRNDQDERRVIRDMMEFNCPSVTECNYDRWAYHQRTGRSKDFNPLKFIEVQICHRDGSTKDYTFEEFKKYLWP